MASLFWTNGWIRECRSSTYVLHCTNTQSLASQQLQNSLSQQLWKKTDVSGKKSIQKKNYTSVSGWFFFLYLSNSHKVLGDGHVSLKLTLAHTLEWLSTMSRSWEWTCNRRQDNQSLNKRGIWPIKSGGHKMAEVEQIWGDMAHTCKMLCSSVTVCAVCLLTALTDSRSSAERHWSTQRRTSSGRDSKVRAGVRLRTRFRAGTE